MIEQVPVGWRKGWVVTMQYGRGMVPERGIVMDSGVWGVWHVAGEESCCPKQSFFNPKREGYHVTLMSTGMMAGCALTLEDAVGFAEAISEIAPFAQVRTHADMVKLAPSFRHLVPAIKVQFHIDEGAGKYVSTEAEWAREMARTKEMIG